MSLTYFILIIFTLGLFVGSFLNVVILRLNTGLSIARGRSKCFSCNKTLSWYELVPLFSFIMQGGRCRGCSSRISWQYPIVELTTGLAFVLAFLHTSSTENILFGILAILFSLYIVIFVYDLRHKIIPDVFSYAAALVALAALAFDIWQTGVFDWTRIITGPALFLFFFSFWFVSRGRWMGLGDAKLALSMGWFLGLSSGIAALLLSFWIGAAIVLLIMLVQKICASRKGGASLGLKSEVPFGPFMLVGFLIVFIFNLDIQSLLSFLAI